MKALADTDHLFAARDGQQTQSGAVQHGEDANIYSNAQGNG
jgi:hypothetical protein